VGRARAPLVEAALQLIDEAFVKKAWHGPNLRGTIRGLTAAEAAWRPGPGRHSVWELVVHAAYWKYAVRRRLTGEKRGSFAYQGSNWFPRPDAGDEGGADANEAAWQRDVRLLVEEHRKLRAVVASLSDRDLGRPASGHRTLVGVLVRGIAAHDLYHAGQIQVVKRLRPA
jgi:DinB family protein